MRNKFLFAFLLLTQIAFGQSEKHVQIPGTKCSMIPPAGFSPASSFSGFQNMESGSSIMVSELPGSYQTVAAGFTKDALKSKGMELIDKNTIDFNSSKATLLYVTQIANGKNYEKVILLFGDLKYTVIVNGIYPEESKRIKETIKSSLLSTVYNKAQKDTPLEAVIFKIDISGTDLKFTKHVSGTFLYTTDGKIPSLKPMFVVGSGVAKVSVPNRRKYAEERLKKLPEGDKTVIKETKEIEIDNLKGYEIVGHGSTKNGSPELIYQVMLFNENGDYYILVGQALEEFEKNLATFRKVATTFKLK